MSIPAEVSERPVSDRAFFPALPPQSTLRWKNFEFWNVFKVGGVECPQLRIVNNCRSCNGDVELAALRAVHLAVGFSGNNRVVGPEWKAVGGWKQGNWHFSLGAH